MRTKRVAVVTIQVDCDPVAGEAHDAENWGQWFLGELNRRCPWYKPKVLSFEEKIVEDPRDP